MFINQFNNINFGWNIKTHIAITEQALSNNKKLSPVEKRMVGRFSQMPDLIKGELQDMNSAHFYDALNEKPSFSKRNSKKNNALSKFIEHTKKAITEKKREKFLRDIGYAVHYLQDVSTPPHTESGSYLHKLFRFPMHYQFERGKKLGASYRLEELKKGYMPEDIVFSNLTSLFHNTALFSVQTENHVSYSNVKKWFNIQQRCFNRAINTSKVYFDYMMKYLPKK